MRMSAMFTEKLHASSAHAVYKVSNVCLESIAPFVNAPVDDHVHDFLANLSYALWDSYLVTSPAIHPLNIMLPKKSLTPLAPCGRALRSWKTALFYGDLALQLEQ